jgi:hypothetical protein
VLKRSSKSNYENFRKIDAMWFLQPIDWTAAAYLVAAYAGLLLLTGLALVVPLALGKRNGFYKRNPSEPLLPDEGTVDWLRVLEMEMGSHIFVWGWFAAAALAAGGDAQTICMCQIIPMLFLVRYFCKVGEKVCAVAGFVFLMMLCYFGFAPVPAPPSIAGTLAPVWVLFHSVLVLLFASMLVTGKTEKMYEDQPGGSAKRMMSVGVGTPVYERELLLAITLLGLGFADISAAITGAAMNLCVIAGPSLFVTGGVHYAIQGDKKNGKTNFAFSVAFVCIGFVAHAIQ